MGSETRLIRRWPCEKCENLWGGPPPCSLEENRTAECETMKAVKYIATRAEIMAAFIATEPDQKVRSIEAEGTFPEYDNALWDMGAAMNQDLYYDLCRVPEGCRECYAKVSSWCVACKEEK